MFEKYSMKLIFKILSLLRFVLRCISIHFLLRRRSERGNLEAVRILLDFNADANVTDAFNKVLISLFLAYLLSCTSNTNLCNHSPVAFQPLVLW